MKTQHHNTAIPRVVFTVEDEQGTTVTSSHDEEEARYFGESLAEFDESRNYYLRPYTLH